jgi:hypothetical protein
LNEEDNAMSCSCRCHHQQAHTPPPIGWWPYYPMYQPPEQHGHACCGGCGKPHDECGCGAEPTAMLPQELLASTASPAPAATLVGGMSDARLTLEYLPDAGSTTASVTLTIAGPEGTDTVTLDSIPAGYHVKDDLVAVTPGSTLTLKVAGCIARVRWCEEIACR